MSIKTTLEARKGSVPAFRPDLLPHHRPRPQPKQDWAKSGGQKLHQNPTSSGPGHNFGQVQVHSDLKAVATPQSCPLASAAPRFCPFGGACHTCPVQVQAKLVTDQPGDVFEQEADRVAGEVMRLSEDQVLQHEGSTCSNHEEEVLQAKGLLVRAPVTTQSLEVPPIIHEVMRSSGQPLDLATRAFMEPRFGQDFSRVRLHTDARAAESARVVNALAYTIGRDVVFGAGQYAPETNAGQRLMAHELTHVAQQHCGQTRCLQKQADDGERELVAEETERPGIKEGAKEEPQPMKDKPKKTKPACTRTILAEGTCADLVAGSKYICCDPDKGIERKGKKTDIEGNSCPDEKFTPIFTCDNKCAKALDKGCDDNDNWMAIPGNQFSKKQCGDIWTICANGKQTTGYVRDRSVTQTRFEVSPGIQKALGVTVGSSFKGAIYRPGAKQAVIDADTCCKSST
jgi:hypothetical protein